jgi:uncharacterized protein
MDIQQRIDRLNWDKAAHDMNNTGYATLPGVLSAEECDAFISQYDDESLYRKKVIMERHQYGKGEYKYFSYPLPQLIQQLRETVYPKLVPIVNNWMQALNIASRFPATLDEQLALCHANNQVKPTALILKYVKGGFNALHQDLYGDIFFPVQMVIFLNEPGKDYEGGEFVLIEQKPRAQSKAIVLNPRKGDMLVFTTNFRPVSGTRGYYRVNMKHGVSEITEGKRHTLGIIFHDAG